MGRAGYRSTAQARRPLERPVGLRRQARNELPRAGNVVDQPGGLPGVDAGGVVVVALARRRDLRPGAVAFGTELLLVAMPAVGERVAQRAAGEALGPPAPLGDVEDPREDRLVL